MDARTALRWLCHLALIVAVGAGTPLWAQDEEQVVTQTLRWGAIEGALGYELKVWSPSGLVVRTRVEAPTAVLQLKPGTYLFSVTVFNVLDQPEIETAPRELVVLRAEIPVPEALVPGQMDASDPVKRFVLRGTFLVEGATVTLVGGPGARPTLAQVVGRSEGQWLLEFPGANLVPGAYDLVVQNPGGLRRTLKGALRVNAERPIDLRLAAGWMGGLPVFDSWFLDVWGRDFVAQGAAGRADVVMVKQGQVQVGMGVDTRYWVQSREHSNLSLSTVYLGAGVEAFSAFVVNRNVRMALRIGGGLTSSHHEFVYETSDGLAWESVDPYASVEVNGSYWFTRWFYVEAGLDFSLGFNNGYTTGFLRPVVLTGFSY